MAKSERKIVGAVSVDGHTKSFVAGDEDALADAIAKDKDGKIDVERLSKAGVLVGFGKGTAESATVVNRQRTAQDDRDDSNAAKGAAKGAADGTPAEGGTAGKSGKG